MGQHVGVGRAARFAAIVLSLCGSEVARAETPGLTVETLFGGFAHLDWSAMIRVRVDNPGSEPMRARVVLELDGENVRQVHPIELEPRASQTFIAAGRLIRRGTAALEVAGDAAPSSLVLSAEVRDGLLVLGDSALATRLSTSFAAEVREFRTVNLELEQLPVRADAYSAVEAMVARRTTFETLEPTRRRAILEWIQRGGRFALLPSDAEVGAPAETRLVGLGTLQHLDSEEALKTWALVGQASRYNDLRAMSERLPVALSSALDPSRDARPWTWAVLILALYVIVAGSVMSTVAQKQRSYLLVFTTPALAVATLLALFVTHSVSRGSALKSRSVEVRETAEGARGGVRIRAASLVFGQGAEVELDADAHASIEVGWPGHWDPVRPELRFAPNGGLELRGLEGRRSEAVPLTVRGTADFGGLSRVPSDDGEERLRNESGSRVLWAMSLRDSAAGGALARDIAPEAEVALEFVYFNGTIRAWAEQNLSPEDAKILDLVHRVARHGWTIARLEGPSAALSMRPGFPSEVEQVYLIVWHPTAPDAPGGEP